MISYYEPGTTQEMRSEQNTVPAFKVWEIQSVAEGRYRNKQWNPLWRNQRNACNSSWGGRKGFWGEKMLDLSLGGWISIELGVPCQKDILKERQQQMQGVEV